MSELSDGANARARKAHSAVLQAMQDPGTQRNLAQVIGVSETTISRTKTEKLEDVLMLLYHLGFKVVSQDKVCVERASYDAMVTMARAAMADDATVRRLTWDE